MHAVKISEVRASNANYERDLSRSLKFATHPNEGKLPDISNRLASERAVRDSPVAGTECFEKLIVVHSSKNLDKGELRDRPLWVNSSLSLLYHLGGWFRPEAAVEKVLLIGVVGSCSVPRVLSEERHIQENETGKEACEERETQFESAVLYGIECDRHKSKDAEYPTNNSNEG